MSGEDKKGSVDGGSGQSGKSTQGSSSSQLLEAAAEKKANTAVLLQLVTETFHDSINEKLLHGGPPVFGYEMMTHVALKLALKFHRKSAAENFSQAKSSEANEIWSKRLQRKVKKLESDNLRLASVLYELDPEKRKKEEEELKLLFPVTEYAVYQNDAQDPNASTDDDDDEIVMSSVKTKKMKF